ncbi:hypothetical protein [Amycolatopsis coloradensis]|nr:hypothetical protein [Amycolatopsis coloradensis]
MAISDHAGWTAAAVAVIAAGIAIWQAREARASRKAAQSQAAEAQESRIAAEEQARAANEVVALQRSNRRARLTPRLRSWPESNRPSSAIRSGSGRGPCG